MCLYVLFLLYFALAHNLPQKFFYYESIANEPFASSLVPVFQNESKSETFHMKMSSVCSFIFMQIKVIFTRVIFALRLALKLRHKGARKWPI